MIQLGLTFQEIEFTTCCNVGEDSGRGKMPIRSDFVKICQNARRPTSFSCDNSNTRKLTLSSIPDAN